MTTTAFDIHVRTLECSRCGAPFATHERGGSVTCSYCGAVNVVAGRQAAERAGASRTLADEVARLSRLKAQLVNPISAHAYDLNQAPLGYSRGELAQAAGMERARNEWQRARGAPPSPVPDEQRKLCWLALQLAEAYGRQRQPLKARAVLETALEVLPDAGHRHLVRCRLALTAIHEGDLDAAAGWLAECDPYPEVLELDSAYREAQATLHARRRDAPALLHVVGARESDIPIAPEHQRMVAMLRIHGLELAGHAHEAASELARASEQFGGEPMRAGLEARALAPATVAHASRRALEDKLKGFCGQRVLMPSNVIEALAPPLAALPLLAAFCMIPIAISRCTLDADPLLGSYGHPLCPRVCEGCHGPVRVVTKWHQTGPASGPPTARSTSARRPGTASSR